VFNERAPQPYSFKSPEQEAEDIRNHPEKQLSSAQIAESVKTSDDPFVKQKVKTAFAASFFDIQALDSLVLPPPMDKAKA